MKTWEYAAIIALSAAAGVCFTMSYANAAAVGDMVGFQLVCRDKDSLEAQIDAIYETGTVAAGRDLYEQAENEQKCIVIPEEMEAAITGLGKSRGIVHIKDVGVGGTDMKIEAVSIEARGQTFWVPAIDVDAK